jgi:thiamine biosynthesis lipoprotein
MTVTYLEEERRFALFGTEVRLLIGAPVHPSLPPPQVKAVEIEAFLRVFHRTLTRFDPASELCALNADPRSCRSVSPLLAIAVRAGIWAARRTAGLVDPTLVGELERAGYATSRAGVRPAPITDAIAVAPPRSPARPHPGSRWPSIEVDLEARTVTRPPGVRIDTGGTGKGLAADLASTRLAGYELHVVDAGGDLRIGGERPVERLVEIEHPLGGPPLGFWLTAGAVATSGIGTRLWRTDQGFAHHLVDPSSGDPAWTGVIQATALADTALGAETLAKAAFLAGPQDAHRVLAGRGGALVLDDGTVELVGPLRELAGEADATETAA